MRPLIFAALAWVFTACATSRREESLRSTASLTPPSEPADRPPDPGRVKFFEGLTLEDFFRMIPEGSQRGDLLARLRLIISGGDPTRVDAGLETLWVAGLFNANSAYSKSWPYKRRGL